jgi:hypothetical protein
VRDGRVLDDDESLPVRDHGTPDLLLEGLAARAATHVTNGGR